MPWTAWLILFGGVLQGVGVGFVVLDVRQTADALRAYKGRPIRKFGSVSLRGGGVMHVKGHRGSPPTLEERLASLEASIEQLREERNEALRKSEEQLRQEINAIRKNTEATFEDQISGLQELIDKITSGGWRRLAAALIVLGLILVTIGGAAAID